MDEQARPGPGGAPPELAIALLTQGEARQAMALLEALLDHGRDAYRALDVLGQVRAGRHGTAYSNIALYINRTARELEHAPSPAMRAPLLRALKHLRERLAAREEAEAIARGAAARHAPQAPEAPPMTVEAAIRMVYETTVWRSPAPTEVVIWQEHFQKGLPFHEFMLSMARSPEARKGGDAVGLAAGTDGRFVQLAHEHTQNRGAGAAEVNHWLQKIETGELSRVAVLSNLFMSGVNWAASLEHAAPHDGKSCRIMGTNRDLTASEWARQARDLAAAAPEPADAQEDAGEPRPGAQRDRRYAHHFRVSRPPQVLVSAITSLYRGGRFIEQFMDNITSQEGFDEYCELVIVDADSPEGEADTIRRYMARHPNINYIRVNHRIGIYDAWNVGAKAARGEYLTNANLDDMRRSDSFMLQAGTLDALPFVDVVYQDLYYTFDPDLSFEAIAAFGHQTNLPVITLHNMVNFNSPHNAPMWRKALHEELGYFDIHFKSAGDYEFWMRCLAAGKCFYKTNDPHVVYYQNPEGLSTRPDSRGLREAMEVHRMYCRKLMPEDVVVSTPDFLKRLHPEGGGVMRPDRYRYAMAQEALRSVARTRKFDGARP